MPAASRAAADQMSGICLTGETKLHRSAEQDSTCQAELCRQGPLLSLLCLTVPVEPSRCLFHDRSRWTSKVCQDCCSAGVGFPVVDVHALPVSCYAVRSGEQGSNDHHPVRVPVGALYE